MEGAEENGVQESPTAGIIVVGDEILKGHVSDANSHFLCRQLWHLGIRVCKVSIVADDVEEIASEVETFSKRYTFVFTSGGIGPTHDDVTVEALAAAFDEPLEENDKLLSICCRLFGDKKASSGFSKMTKVPVSTQLCFPLPEDDKVFSKYKAYPVLRLQNVFAFPGVPVFLKDGFHTIKHLLKQESPAFHLCEVRLKRSEVELATTLASVQRTVEPTVQLGSYPQFDDRRTEESVVLRLESTQKQELVKARKLLLRRLSENAVVTSSFGMSGLSPHSDECVPTNLRTSLDAVLQLASSHDGSHLSSLVYSAIGVIDEAMLYTYDNVCISFNGGKDCTVLLHLLAAVLHRRHMKGEKKIQPLGLYIRSSTPFDEVEEFIIESSLRYNLDLITLECSHIEALRRLKESHRHIKAILMGTRRTDPFAANLEEFAETDTGWPSFTRVNPILDWSYSDVWFFLRSLDVPYCCLYDKGYTSLGGRHNTVPNPTLAIGMSSSDSSEAKYRPAYQLEDDDKERDGRT